MFETHVLAALSGEVASFPYTTSEFDGKGSTHEIKIMISSSSSSSFIKLISYNL